MPDVNKEWPLLPLPLPSCLRDKIHWVDVLSSDADDVCKASQTKPSKKGKELGRYFKQANEVAWKHVDCFGAAASQTSRSYSSTVKQLEVFLSIQVLRDQKEQRASVCSGILQSYPQSRWAEAVTLEAKHAQQSDGVENRHPATVL